MKRLFSAGPKKTVLKEVEMPSFLSQKDVLIKLKYCGVCMSEHYDWSVGREGRAFGHEPVGEIVEVGSEVTGFKVGDRVSGLFDGSAEYARAHMDAIVKIPDNVKDEEAVME